VNSFLPVALSEFQEISDAQAPPNGSDEDPLASVPGSDCHISVETKSPVVPRNDQTTPVVTGI